MRLIANKTRLQFTHSSGETVTGIFIFEDEDGVFIRTDDAPVNEPGANWGLHPLGFYDWKMIELPIK